MINPENIENRAEIFVTSAENTAEVFVQNSQIIPNQISSDFDTQTGAVKTVTESSKISEKLPDYYQVGDKYIDLILKNPNNTRVLINVTDLHDIYTAGEGINISNQVISAIFPEIEWGDIAGELQNQTDLQTALSTKQSVISDLSEIRSGAALGTTALQSSDIDSSLSVSSTNPIQNCVVTTGLNGKADTDLSNITPAANILIAHNAMPSDTYEDLTLGASGTSYTAPADGYFYISKQAGSDWYYFELEINDSNGNFLYAGWNSDYRNSPCVCFVPIKKGNICKVIYNAYGITNHFRFIYAQGSESEVS